MQIARNAGGGIWWVSGWAVPFERMRSRPHSEECILRSRCKGLEYRNVSVGVGAYLD